MSERLIDLSDRPCHLRLENGCLVLQDKSGEAPPITIPLGELGAVVLSHPAISLSQAVLAGLGQHNVPLVVSDPRRLPVGMLLPIVAHGTQVERFAQQAALKQPRRKRLWQAIVRAKLLAQAGALEQLGRRSVGLEALAARVRSGDPDNLEAQGAQRYWRVLFDDPTFRRSREGAPPNNALNYAYAVLRATVARAVCACGLHPSIGLHHHNRYDSFALASDLMEPFRPLLDLRVAALAARSGIGPDLEKEVRAELLSAFVARFSDGAESRTLGDWVLRTAQALARAMFEPEAAFDLPRLAPSAT